MDEAMLSPGIPVALALHFDTEHMTAGEVATEVIFYDAAVADELLLQIEAEAA